MNLRVLAVCLLASGAAAFAAEEKSGEQPVPQPRPRLYTYVSLAGVPTAGENRSGDPEVVTMERMEVTESKGPAVPKEIKEPPPKRFSPQRGGAIFSGKLGDLPVDVGMWKYEDMFAADARFKPRSPTVVLDIVRIRF